MPTWALLIAIPLLILGSSNAAFGLDQFSFSNQYFYVDESKILHLLGRVTNESGETVKDIRLSAKFYDSAGNELGEFTRDAEARTLLPGASSPFEILFLDQETSEIVSDYTLSATANATSELKEERFTIKSSNSRQDLLGTFYLNAVATNTGEQTATNTIMIATLYDRDGKVVAIGRALAEAVRGTADVPANSDAAFGIVVTEKLQTYKAVRYSLFVQSDQYVSPEVMVSDPGQGTGGGNQTQSGCLIATAAFGSELAPQVQLLREFRDTVAMETLAGSSFMAAFNNWYYSFSPSVAEYERQSPWAREAVQVLIQPLLFSLAAATSLHHSLSAVGVDSETAIVMTGISASSLIGILYLGPAAALVGLRTSPPLTSKYVKVILSSCWIGSVSLLVIAGTWMIPSVISVAAAAVVICSMGTGAIVLSDRLARLRTGVFRRRR